ncbi:wHTH domain-containing protein [Actinomadura rupiterrae]|uniref:wHTH domain-containing protein n=1 Tax=Actinomadura rupiterrae TaxID=559627 RepID=UPI0020A52459|nr:hypothetical protein [Actinomadura rupiterrae]MCP2338124.1 hypothetical protein [Actinomadura rupiterrae]
MPINRDSWPADGPLRRLVEFLDGVHREHGMRSLSTVASAMAMTSRTNLSDILRGKRPPADHRQAWDLVLALGGSPEQAREGVALFAATKPGRPDQHPWALRASAHEVWTRVDDADACSRASSMAGFLGALADEAAAGLADDPWLDTGLGLRITARVEGLLRGPLRDLDALSPAEASLLALIPLLHQTHVLRALARLRLVDPLAVCPTDKPPSPPAGPPSPSSAQPSPSSAAAAPVASPSAAAPVASPSAAAPLAAPSAAAAPVAAPSAVGSAVPSSAASLSSERRAFEVFLREHPELTARAQAPELPDRKNARGEIGWWLFHRWLARYPRLYNLSEIRSLLGSDDLLDAETVQRLLYALRLDVSELTSDDRGKALRRESRTADGEQVVREQLLGHVFAVAAGMAIDLTRLPDVVVRHLGIPGALDLADLRNNVTGRVRWIPGPDALLLSARCGHPAELEGLNGYAARVDGLLHAVRRAARKHAHLSQLAALPSRATADEVTAGTDEEGRPLFQGVSRFRLDERRVQELLMGEQLYQDRSLAVRELYQNALDACRYREARIAHLRHQGLWLDDWTGRIAFRQGTDENGRAFIECADNGIGMTESVLTEVFAQAGTRFTDMPDFLDEAAEWEAARPAVPFFPNSRFGIGVLSYFMLADEIEITTRPMGRRGDPQPTLKVSIFGPGHLFRIEHVALERSPGTTVRLYLRPGDRSNRSEHEVDCMDALNDWLYIAQFDTTVTLDGELRGDWRAGELGGSGEAEADVLASWAEPGGGTVTWVRREGAVLVDGLLMEPPGRTMLRDPARPHGFVVNLTGTRTPPRISVDRRKVLSDISADVEDLIKQAAPALVGPDAPPLTAEWLFWLTDFSPRTADTVVAAAIEAGGRIEHGAGVWDASRTGCFILDAHLTWSSRRHAPWDCFAGTGRPVVFSLHDVGEISDGVVLWRVLAHGLGAELGLPGLDDLPDVLPALPSDVIVLGEYTGTHWGGNGTFAAWKKLHEAAHMAEMAPRDLLERAKALRAPERGPADLADMPEPDPGRWSTELVISSDPETAAPLLSAIFAHGADLDAIGPAQIETLRERLWSYGCSRRRTDADEACFEGRVDLPVLLRETPVPLFSQIVVAAWFGLSVERVRTVLGWLGFKPDRRDIPQSADLVHKAKEMWRTFREDRAIRPTGICRAAIALGISPAAVAELLTAWDVHVGFSLPDDLEDTDLRLLETYAGVRPAPLPETRLELTRVVRAAETAGTTVETAARRLAAYGYPPLPNGVPELDGITRHMIAHTLPLSGPDGPFTTVTMADLIRIQAAQGAEFAETAARLAGCGFTVPDLDGWVPDPDDVRILRRGAGSSGGWLDRDRPVGLLHLVRAAWETERTVPEIAGRLRLLGMNVPPLDETIKTALTRVPRAAPVPS